MGRVLAYALPEGPPKPRSVNWKLYVLRRGVREEPYTANSARRLLKSMVSGALPPHPLPLTPRKAPPPPAPPAIPFGITSPTRPKGGIHWGITILAAVCVAF